MGWLAVAILTALPACVLAATPRPNVVIIVMDDLGYGDLGCYGNRVIRTPAMDRLAAEGIRLTEFYTFAPTCSPARATLLTGRHPLRTGVTRIFIPKEVQGLPTRELTLAEHLKGAGYSTACIGKWHLGGRRQHRPQKHGFDEFYGVLYSNNMAWIRRLQWPRLELIDGWNGIESPADQALLTRRYTHRAIRFIQQNRDRPFFLYLAYTMPHIPLAASEAFRGRSGNGLYADVIEELDASVGQLMATLRASGLGDRTHVFLTSDNGPWLGDGTGPGGSAGGLRGSKGTTWEGGVRVPLIAWAPGRLPAGETRDGPMTLADIFPTVSTIADVPLPVDRRYDGADLMPYLRSEASVPERNLHFSHRASVHSVRSGPWKLHLRERTRDKKGRPRWPRDIPSPLLYRLDTDAGETTDLAAMHPDVVDELSAGARQFMAETEPTVRLRPYGWAILRGLLTPKP